MKNRKNIIIVIFVSAFCFIFGIVGTLLCVKIKSKADLHGDIVSEIKMGKDQEKQRKINNNFPDRVCTMDQEFFDMIENNPIDKDMIQADVSNRERIEMAVKYQDAWQAEIENTLAVLKAYLVPEDYQTLFEAYQNWEVYISNTQMIEIELFYPSMKYNTGESLTYPLPMEVKAARIRDYAISLMSLEYEFTGTVEFIYQTK